MSALTVSVVLPNRRRTSYGATHAACACKCARAHAPWASMRGLTSELSSTCGRTSPSRMCWMTAALQPRKSRRRCSPSACGTRKISSHAAARTSTQKCIVGPASDCRSQETRTHRGLLRVDAPILSTQIGDSGNYLHIDPSDDENAAAGGVRSGLHRLLLPAHVEADGLTHTHSVALPLCRGHVTVMLMA